MTTHPSPSLSARPEPPAIAPNHAAPIGLQPHCRTRVFQTEIST